MLVDPSVDEMEDDLELRKEVVRRSRSSNY